MAAVVVNPHTAVEWAKACNHLTENNLDILDTMCPTCADAYARQQVREALEEAEKIARQHPQCHTEPRDEKTTGCAYAIGDVIAALRKKIA